MIAVTVTTGGAISGYCAIGSTRIDARPARMMKIDRTAAKIGRSMKKRENISSPAASGPASRPSSGPAGLRAFFSAIFTGAPGPIFITPSTITRSPPSGPS